MEKCPARAVAFVAAIPMNPDGFVSAEQVSAVESVLDHAVPLAADWADDFRILFFLGNVGHRRYHGGEVGADGVSSFLWVWRSRKDNTSPHLLSPPKEEGERQRAVPAV